MLTLSFVVRDPQATSTERNNVFVNLAFQKRLAGLLYCFDARLCPYGNFLLQDCQYESAALIHMTAAQPRY